MEQFRRARYESGTEPAQGSARATGMQVTFWARLDRAGVPSGPANGSRCEFSSPATSGRATNCFSPTRKRPRVSTTCISESTYGGRDRRGSSRRRAPPHAAASEVRAAMSPRALLIPSFAVERTQELIADLVRLMVRASCRP